MCTCDEDMTPEEFDARMAAGTPATLNLSAGVTVTITECPPNCVVSTGPPPTSGSGAVA